MLNLPNSHGQSKMNHSNSYPNIVLLDDKQWLYVQNRYNLTPRELQIAEMLCHGLRNGSIAKNLRIKP